MCVYMYIPAGWATLAGVLYQRRCHSGRSKLCVSLSLFPLFISTYLTRVTPIKPIQIGRARAHTHSLRLLLLLLPFSLSPSSIFPSSRLSFLMRIWLSARRALCIAKNKRERETHVDRARYRDGGASARPFAAFTDLLATFDGLTSRIFFRLMRRGFINIPPAVCAVVGWSVCLSLFFQRYAPIRNWRWRACTVFKNVRFVLGRGVRNNTKINI